MSLRKFRHILVLFAVVLWASPSIAQVFIEKPAASHPTSLIIVIDKHTYENAAAEVKAYKNMLETDEKLSTYVVVNDWKSPEQVVAEIRKIASQKPVPEGVVLIGDIPVVMVRNAQHMTTAFKMNETTFPMNRSSVASDRFYDDFDLKFRFLKKDEEKKNWFYYELDERGPQHIQSDIYSSRIMSHKEGDAAYEDIRTFLKKAVAARKTMAPLKNLTAFTGSAYNSESLTSWADESMALRELFPVAFANRSAKFLNFRMDEKMKYRLFTELQTPGSDLVIFTEHGDIEVQYINNPPSGNDRSFFVNSLRADARQSMRNAVRQGKDTSELKRYFDEKYGLDARWFEGAFDNDSLRAADSMVRADQDIRSSEISRLRLTSKMAIFDACYNGSFHHPENVSQAYIFNQGKTLVVHGNTVNVLQDKWTLEHTGLLNHGIRAGFWGMITNSLESHLIGDPTWHFSSEHAKLNKDIIIQKSNSGYWLRMMKKNDPALQALALKMLARMDYRGINELLLKTFHESPSANVRMQSLALLSSAGNSFFSKVVPAALHDDYELIRRKAATWIGRSGDQEHIPLLVSLAIERPLDDRVIFSIDRSLELLDPVIVRHEIQKQIAEAGHVYGREEMMKRWLDVLGRRQQSAEATLSTIADDSKSLESRINAARTIRNYTYHHRVPDLINIAADTSQPALLRQNIIEALGWFSISYNKELIMEFCRKVEESKTESREIADEAQQTILRLTNWNLY